MAGATCESSSRSLKRDRPRDRSCALGEGEESGAGARSVVHPADRVDAGPAQLRADRTVVLSAGCACTGSQHPWPARTPVRTSRSSSGRIADRGRVAAFVLHEGANVFVEQRRPVQLVAGAVRRGRGPDTGRARPSRSARESRVRWPGTCRWSDERTISRPFSPTSAPTCASVIT
jgi:hypothetical protein